MNTLPLLRRAFDLAVYPLVVLLLFLPSLVFEVATDETFKVTSEFLIVSLAWAAVAAVAGARTLAGLPLMSAGAGSWARRFGLALAAWLLISSLTAYNPASSWPYFLTAVAYMLLAQSLLDWLQGRPGRRAFVLGSLSVLLVMQGIVCLLQFVGAPLADWGAAIPVYAGGGEKVPGTYWVRDFLLAMGSSGKTGQIVGALGNINYLAEFLILAMPVCLLWLLSAKRLWLRLLGTTSVALVGLVLIATGARAALVGLLLAGLLSAGVVFGWRALSPARWWASTRGKLALAVGTLGVIALLVVGGERLMTKLSPAMLLNDVSVTSRLVNWKTTLHIWADAPITGVGLGGYKLLTAQKHIAMFPDGAPESVATARFLQAHSEPLQLLAETGLVGLVLAALALGFWARETHRNPDLAPAVRWGVLWGVGAVLLAGLFGFPFHIPLTALVFVMLLALGLSRDAAPEPAAVPAWRYAYAAVALLMIGTVATQAFQKGVWPLYLAHRYRYVAEKLKDANSLENAETVMALADRHQRFKGDVRWQLLQLKVVNNKPDEALALYDVSAKDGLAVDGAFWKGRAHQLKGQHAEALRAYEVSKRFYPANHDSHKRAAGQTRLIEAQAKAATGTP